MFVGYIPINDTLNFPVITVDGSNLPADSSPLPTYRVYSDPNTVIATGSLTKFDSGTITGASNATPIVITAVNHGLSTGTKVTVASVGGNTNANGVWAITKIDADHFSLNTSSGSGAYTTGGTWAVTGLYNCSITPTLASGYGQGLKYDVIVYSTVSGSIKAQSFWFGVI